MGFLVSGCDFFGEVDTVPDLFSVVTDFTHVFYFPLLPLRSLAVLKNPAKPRLGISVRMRGRSVLLAWFRGICLSTAIIAGFITLITAVEKSNKEEYGGDVQGASSYDVETPADVTFFASAGFAASYFLRRFLFRASFGRAMFLGQQLGLSQEQWKQLEAYFGRKCPDECKAPRFVELKQLRSTMNLHVGV
jgi:hypothetical protein